MRIQPTTLIGACVAASLSLAQGQTQIDLRTQSKSIDFSAAAVTKPFATGTSLPVTCTPGQTYYLTSAVAGMGLNICLANGTWAAQFPSLTGNANGVLSTDGTSVLWRVPGGDLSGPLNAATVTGIGGRALSITAPVDGQFLRWNGTTAQWEPFTAPLSLFGRTGLVTGQSGDYTFPQISGTVLSGQLPAAGGDLSGTLTAATVTKLQNRTVAATVPAMGQTLTWNGAQWAPGGVTGVFGRTGAVTGQNGDYAFSQISGSIAGGQLPAAGGDLSGSLTNASVTKIQGFPVSSTTPTSGQVLAWTGSQWGAQAVAGGVSSVYGRAGAITAQSGDYTAAQVTNAANVTVANTYTAGAKQTFTPNGSNSGILIVPAGLPFSPQAGDLAIDSADSNKLKTYNGAAWTTVASGGGVTMASQLGDLNGTRTALNGLTIGANCANATPCNVRLGTSVISIQTSSLLTLTAGTGTVYVYVDSSGTLIAGHNLTLTCSAGCTALGGITAFPTGSIPLFTWTATNGTWDLNGGIDKRAFLSGRNLAAGAGIATVDNGTLLTVAVDSATVPTYLAATGTLDFPSIAAGACSELTLALSGAASGDPVAAGWPGGLENGLIGIMRISSANTVTVRLCNVSGSPVNPAAATFQATVVRSF